MTTGISSIAAFSSSSGTSKGIAINNAGQVAVEFFDPNNVETAKLWSNGSTISAPIPPPNFSVESINDSGAVVGYGLLQSRLTAVLWENGTVIGLPFLGKNINLDSAALGINNSGQIVGRSTTATNVEDPCLWQNGTVTDLGLLPGAVVPSSAGLPRAGIAWAINDSGQIAGQSYNSAGLVHAVEWSNGAITDLGASAALTESQAVAINKVGQIVGNGYLGTGPEQALLWQNGKLIQLGTPTGYDEAYAQAINAAGIIGGYADNSNDPAAGAHAVIWENGQVVDLNNLLSANSGWVLLSVQGINDQGQVTGRGIHNGVDQAFLISLNSSPAVNASAQTALTALGTGAASATVSDSAADIASNLDALNVYASNGKLTSIQFTDAGIPNLTLTAAQLAADGAALGAASADFTVMVTASTSSVTAPAARGTTVQFSGNAASYAVSAIGDHSGVAVQIGSSHYTLTGITALKFDDVTEIVAQAPGSNGTVTSGNVTELYGAVFGRLPDVAGLAYYEAELKANPALSMTTLAQTFLASPEYIGNPAHAYAQNSTGDGQFINDVYANLLHRQPETGAIPYYQDIVARFTQGLTPGTASYLSAQAAGHATVLVDFSNSAEFLNDVQITSQNAASALHWLLLT